VAVGLVWSVGMMKGIRVSFWLIALIPAYSFGVSNQELMDRLDDIEIRRMIDQDLQRQQQYQQQMQNFYQDNLRMQYVPTPREYAVESAGFLNISVPEYYRREEVAAKTCYRPYGGMYKIETQQATICHLSIILQVTEQEASRRNANSEKYCSQLSGDKGVRCNKDYLVLGKKNILGFAF
jgi:hypothetical protein